MRKKPLKLVLSDCFNSENAIGAHMPPLVLAWFLAAVVRNSLGSAIVKPYAPRNLFRERWSWRGRLGGVLLKPFLNPVLRLRQLLLVQMGD